MGLAALLPAAVTEESRRFARLRPPYYQVAKPPSAATTPMAKPATTVLTGLRSNPLPYYKVGPVGFEPTTNGL